MSFITKKEPIDRWTIEPNWQLYVWINGKNIYDDDYNVSYTSLYFGCYLFWQYTPVNGLLEAKQTKPNRDRTHASVYAVPNTLR